MKIREHRPPHPPPLPPLLYSNSAVVFILFPPFLLLHRNTILMQLIKGELGDTSAGPRIAQCVIGIIRHEPIGPEDVEERLPTQDQFAQCHLRSHTSSKEVGRVTLRATKGTTCDPLLVLLPPCCHPLRACGGFHLALVFLKSSPPPQTLQLVDLQASPLPPPAFCMLTKNMKASARRPFLIPSEQAPFSLRILFCRYVTIHARLDKSLGVFIGVNSLHIHQWGDTTFGNETGEHFNPLGSLHGCPPYPRMMGDLGNVISGSYLDVFNTFVALHGPPGFSLHFTLCFSPRFPASALSKPHFFLSQNGCATMQPPSLPLLLSPRAL
jgi:hypothetical protein